MIRHGLDTAPAKNSRAELRFVAQLILHYFVVGRHAFPVIGNPTGMGFRKSLLEFLMVECFKISHATTLTTNLNSICCFGLQE